MNYITISDIVEDVCITSSNDNQVKIIYDSNEFKIPVYYDSDIEGVGEIGLHFYNCISSALHFSGCFTLKGVHLPSRKIEDEINYFRVNELVCYNYTIGRIESIINQKFEEINFVLYLVFHEFAHFIDLLLNFNGDSDKYKQYYHDDFINLEKLRKKKLSKEEFQVKYNEDIVFERTANQIAIKLLKEYHLNPIL
jgi:hypothetical protein